MDLEQAIELLKTVVKNNSTNDENHMDLTLVPTEDRAKFEKALIIVRLAIQDGKISQDEFRHRVHIDT